MNWTANLPRYIAEFRKGLIAALGALAVISSMGILPAPWDKYVAAVLALASALGVTLVPNQPKGPQVS